MPLPAKHRKLVIAGSLVALMLIASAGWVFLQSRAENAEFVGFTTHSTGARSASFIISNPSSNSVQIDETWFIRSTSSTNPPYRIEPVDAGKPELGPHERRRFEFVDLPKEQELVLEGILWNLHCDKRRVELAYWISGRVNATTRNPAMRAKLKRFCDRKLGVIYEVWSVPFRPDQPVNQEAAAGAAP
ncbi:MAG: hypothetical protein J0L84_07265 [Verrucomicrobia bacterium]|nr:hypothetical protein [Verrucomicrobiota bacterium]